VTPVNPNPIPNNPTGGNPTASGNAGSSQQPTLPPVNPAPAQPKPAISTPDPKSSDDWRQLHDFYTQIGPRADAILRYMEQMRIQTERNRGVFRVDLQTAMNGVRDGLNMAKRALDGGDTDAARSYLTTAYQHLQTLEQARH